jgi:hypothetical protein
MKKIILAGLLLFCTTVLWAQKKEAKAVEKVFENYKEAILQSDGEKALSCIDKNTLDYYDKMLQYSISADSASIHSLPFMDKMLIFSVRHRIPKSEVLDMDVEAFFTYAVDKGWVGKTSVESIKLSKVNIQGKTAYTELVANGEKAPFGFHFHKEGGMWKIDLTSIFDFTNASISSMLEVREVEEYAFVFELLKTLTGREVPSSIWQAWKSEPNE